VTVSSPNSPKSSVGSVAAALPWRRRIAAQVAQVEVQTVVDALSRGGRPPSAPRLRALALRTGMVFGSISSRLKSSVSLRGLAAVVVKGCVLSPSDKVGSMAATWSAATAVRLVQRVLGVDLQAQGLGLGPILALARSASQHLRGEQFEALGVAPLGVDLEQLG
jgi:hypothetical protein